MSDVLEKTYVHKSTAHDSAQKHVTGKATYVDDIPEPANLLHIYVAKSTISHGKILSKSLDQVRTAPGVICVLTESDIPGDNDYSPFAGDDPVFAEDQVDYWGQPLFAVAAESLVQAKAATSLAEIEYQARTPIVTIHEARKQQSIIEDTQCLRLGNAQKALDESQHSVSGRLSLGGQDHFYLEGQIALVLPQEDGDVLIHVSSQNPTEVQHVVARILGRPENAVIVEVRRMGGGFGGKETQPSLIAAIASLAALKTGRPAKLRLDRDDDMIITGKRHEFDIQYMVGFNDKGQLNGVNVDLASRCGYSADLSPAINDRAMYHTDNAYFLKNADINSHRLKTHTVSNTAFRGFGGPQGVIAIERAMDHIAHHLKRDPLDVRKTNLYGRPGSERTLTPYHQEVEDSVILEIIEELERSSEYRQRKESIKHFNENHAFLKKGIALTPVKFGISFTATHLNQAGALLHVYKDGSIHLNHGGTEMGQGLFVKVAQIVAEVFHVDLERIKITPTNTGKVPNTSATAASSGSDLNGMAARHAAETIKDRMVHFASKHFRCSEADIRFTNNRVHIGKQTLAFSALAHLAYMNRISLSSTGFYSTPKIWFDREKQQGRPFYYFAYGAACSEVVIDTLTGENKVLRTDILHETGHSLNPAIDIGQIEGGFIQGMGWLTTEELYYDSEGQLKTHAPSTYKIPTCSDRPQVMNIKLWDKGRNIEKTIFRSKAVGEPPFMLATSVFCALADAVASVANHQMFPELDAPATPERLLAAISKLKSQSE